MKLESKWQFVMIAIFISLVTSISESQSNLTIESTNSTTAPLEEFAGGLTTSKKANLTVTVYGRSVEDNFARSQQVASLIKPEFVANYGNYLEFGGAALAVIGTGNASNFWNDDGKPSNSVLIDEGYLKIKPHSNLNIKFGAIKTKINPLTSILSENTWIGSVEKWQIGADNSHIALQAVQAIPGSGSVSKRIYDDGTQAYFLAQTVLGKIKSEETGTELILAGTRYQFENLSTNVATDSYFLGNSLTSFEGVGKALRYKIGFMGTESGMDLKQAVGKHEACFFATQIKNDQAPSETNSGYNIGGCFKMVIGNLSVKPMYTRFDYGADVTPATYTLVTSRYHNRSGNRVGLDVELIKEKLAFKSYYIKADLKDQNYYLADREIYNLAVEAKYDLF